MNPKIISPQTLKKKLTALRRAGKIIAFTNGCFDLMHLGHVKYLQAAKAKNREPLYWQLSKA